MLTRLEADGFKNLLGFSVDFGPYTCIAGPNGSGKSNVFDAIEFFSLLADHPFVEAAQRVRLSGVRLQDPRTLFWKDSDGTYRDMNLAAEMLVPSELEDDFGRPVRPTSTFLRYEIQLALNPDETRGGLSGSIQLVRERLNYITKGASRSHLRWPHSSRFRDSLVINNRTGTEFISTEEGRGVINVHQDGGSRGKPRTSPANKAPRTVVSTTTTSDDPTILAARREMQQWRTLALEPSAMRAPDSISDPSQIGTNGAHLAATLHRLTKEDEAAPSKVAAEAAALTDVREVVVDMDPHRDLLTLQARLGNGPALPARSLSDGTLRFLALCIISIDASYAGLLCMEEPENGIHPGRMNAMVELVRGLAVDPMQPAGVDNPLRQVIVNTHSPAFVANQDVSDLLLALPTALRTEDGQATSVRLVALKGGWRSSPDGPSVTKRELADYLSVPDGTQLQLEY